MESNNQNNEKEVDECGNPIVVDEESTNISSIPHNSINNITKLTFNLEMIAVILLLVL